LNNIRILRYKHDLNQKDLAKRTGLHRSVVSDLENGKRELTLYYKIKLEKIFGEGAIEEGVN